MNFLLCIFLALRDPIKKYSHGPNSSRKSRYNNKCSNKLTFHEEPIKASGAILTLNVQTTLEDMRGPVKHV